MRTGLAALIATLLLAGCATPEPLPVAEAWPDDFGYPPPPPPPPPAVAPRKPPRMESQPLKHLANRNLAPIADRPLNVKTSCSFRDPTGYNGRLDLQVKDADVHRFRAQINVPRQGSCRFDLKEFKQADRLPVALAKNGSGSCAVRIWEQEGRVTVAFRDCQTQCSGETFDYVWPILVDAKSGKCS